MKTLKLLFLLPLSILSLELSAQIDDLLRDKDITWVAESYNDFIIDESRLDKKDKVMSRTNPLKFINNSEDVLDDRYAIQQWIVTAARNGKFRIYADSDCLNPINANHIWSRDSIYVMNPNTFELQMKVVPNHIDPERIVGFKARQVVYYNARKARFDMRTVAVAPIFIFNYSREDGLLQRCQPLFWFKPQDLTRSQRLSKKSITWGRRMDFSSGIALNEDSRNILKHTSETNPIDDLLTVFERNRRTSFYKREEGLNASKKIPFEDRKKMLWQTDTVAVTDSVGSILHYAVQNSKIESPQVTHLQLIQNWYWNKRKQQLEIYLVATAPLADRFYWRYKMPLFYRRTDD